MTTSAPYALDRRAPVVTATERPYVLAFRDLPDQDRPRERLASQGPAALSTAELIAVLFSTGTSKEDVLSMATRVAKEYGERAIMQETDPHRLSTESGLPLGKSLQIVAAAELGRRFHQKSEFAPPMIRTARDAFEHVADMRRLPKEHLRGLYLNAHYRLVHDETLAIGTVDANLVHPREVFRPALEHAAVAVILVHNHPSGSVEPSAADLAVTAQVVEAGRLLGIEIVDHLIVAGDRYASVPAPYRA